MNPYTQDRLRYLYLKQLENTLREEESVELLKLLSQEGARELLSAFLYEKWKDLDGFSQWKGISDQKIEALLSGLSADEEDKPNERITYMRTPWLSSQPSRVALRWTKYAAAILLFIGIGTYLWIRTSENTTLVQHTKPIPTKDDVPAGSNRAILTLSDGRKIDLTPETGNIPESGFTIQNLGGELSYSQTQKTVMNTMSTPRGGQYQLTLSDGTRVWLNAASSITYPTSFIEEIRRVKISGEAYLEVKPDKSKPFIVQVAGSSSEKKGGADRAGNDEITVLGTSFNIHDYHDEKLSKTSLIEGSIKINNSILKPGEAYRAGKIIKTNIEQDIAWKNGILNFTNVSLEEAMRQISRWYDVEVVYEKGIPEVKLGGRLGRDLSLKQVTKALEIVGLHFRIDGKKLIVTQ